MARKHPLLILLIVLPYFSAADPLPGSTASKLNSKRHPLIAGTETLLINAAFTGVTSYVFNFPWARPTAETIYENLTSPWEWETTDGFTVNQLGHPYQGSLYFNAGRATVLRSMNPLFSQDWVRLPGKPFARDSAVRLMI